jgi:hypothetical protein
MFIRSAPSIAAIDTQGSCFIARITSPIIAAIKRPASSALIRHQP